MTKSTWGVAILGLALASAAQPAAADDVSRGLNLIGLAAGYDEMRADEVASTATLGLGYERLLTERFSLGAQLAMSQQELSEQYSSASYRELSGFAGYYLPGRRGSLFLGTRVGVGIGGRRDTLTLSAGVGYVVLVGSPRLGPGLKVEVAYLHRRYGERLVDDVILPGMSTNGVGMSLGVNFHFRSRRSAALAAQRAQLADAD